MVSPSKHQHQQQQQQQQQHLHHHRRHQHGQPSRENISDPRRTSHVRVQKGLKSLEKKSFYLDIKNHVIAAKLEAKIRELGGTIELFLVRSVSLVISDRVDKTGRTNFEKHRWTCASGGSGGPRSLRSIEVPTPTPTPPTPLLSSECPSSNFISLRGQTTQRSKSRVDAMLERALTQPQQCSVDPLDNAHNWEIPIWATEKFQAWLDKIYASFKDTYSLKQLKQANQRNAQKNLKVRHLKGSYIKFESFHRITRPVFLELSSWPTLNFDGDLGSCPFDTKKQGKRESKLTNKEIKENKEAIESTNRAEGKEMTRRPRATAARARRTEQLVAGYCEICHVHYDDLSKHLQSEQHLNFVGNDDNFLSLDTLINAGANVEAFLKLNRTKDIEKDCDCFPNGDGNLHNAVLPEEKINKNTKSLNNFSVDEIKMVNGARRNLNLKLSSPHNLRTRTAKHESGHLLRSKGSPRHEVDKSEKLYDKLEGFTIKKRSKGTIWIEEDDPDEKYEEDILRKESKREDYKRPFSNDIDDILNTKEDNISSKHSINLDPPNLQPAIVHNNTQNGIINSCRISEESNYLKNKDECNGDENACALECMISVENGVVDNSYTGSCKPCKNLFQRDNCALQVEKVTIEARKLSDDAKDFVCNEYNDKSEQKDSKVLQGESNARAKPKLPSRLNRRGGRSIRGRYRHRLSVEERLIEDNRAYYKVEVLGNKLRSSAVTGSGNPQIQHVGSKDGDSEEKKEAPSSSEKPVVVRFKRVRKSELSLLSDEAESFMFGEPKRDDSNEQSSDSEQSSVLPKDTENSEADETANSSTLLSSPLNSSVKQEIIEEDSQDSVHLGRARKRRRTQAEAFIKDNTDYYKFETPGSRLRYQAPLTGIKDTAFADSREHATLKKSTQQSSDCKSQIENIVEKIYPSKPSTEIEKMQFSFEAIPKSEPWYQTYQRQDTGAEFWHCFSECDTMKPFLLPYEIENFHETLMKIQNRIDTGGRKRGRGRGIGCAGRSPRKSPRCHASTLAIMSTIIRKREQQQSSTLCTIEETPSFIRSCTNTPKFEPKQDLKSDLDEDVKEIGKTIDDMLSAKDMITELDDSFEPDIDLAQADSLCGTPKGAPSNLLELLDNCQDIVNCLENNSSCASSECGEANIDTPLKRRKRRKNRTGWPIGNKMKKKIQTNNKLSVDSDRELLLEKRLHPDRSFARNTLDTSSKLSEGTDSHTVTTSNNNVVLPTVAERLNINRKNDTDTLLEICTTNTSHKSCHEALAKRDKSVEVLNDDNTSLSANTGSYVESLSISENTCDDTTNKNYLSNKDYPCRKDLSKIEEISENDETGNDENHENQKSLFGRKDVNAITERNLVVKSSSIVRKQRQRDHVAVAIAVDNNSCESRDTEIENRDNIQLQQCRKEAESGIVPKKHHNANSELSSPKRQLRGGNCEENSSENTGELLKQHGRQHGIVFAATRRGRMGSRRRIYSRKRQSKTAVAHNNLSSSDHHVSMVYDDENCKKDAYLNITSTCNKKQSPSSGVRSAKRKSEAISSSDNVQESSDPMMDQCALSERVISPSSVISSTELEQRRSSIEFQPVVRMMKLDDQVDVDHGILSTVTVASNRRLRSSGGSPRSNNPKPPKKRIKSSRGHFGRWLKSS